MLNQYQTIVNNIEKYNRLFPLASELKPFVPERDKVFIADIGSGPFSKVGWSYPGKEVVVVPSDSQDFSDFYDKYEVKPIYPIEYQNMELLTYPSETFDIVHCSNALDHTKDAKSALEEMIRACKPGGWVYIDLALYQKDTGGKHYWNATEQGMMESDKEIINLKDYGFKITNIDNGGEPRYNHIIATLEKA